MVRRFCNRYISLTKLNSKIKTRKSYSPNFLSVNINTYYYSPKLGSKLTPKIQFTHRKIVSKSVTCFVYYITLSANYLTTPNFPIYYPFRLFSVCSKTEFNL